MFEESTKMSKYVLVTGGNSGIGLALCKILVKDHGCHVFLGSRNLSKGIVLNVLTSVEEQEHINLKYHFVS